MFWTMSCGRRVTDGRWWTYWWTAPSAGGRLNDPKCAPCWPTAAAPGCSSACDRKPLTCPAVFCSSVDGGKTAGRGRRLERSLGNAQSPNEKLGTYKLYRRQAQRLLAERKGLRVRNRLAAGGNRIRTIGPA